MTRKIKEDLKILVADDNVINLKVAVHLLKKLGFAPDTATNGSEALQAVEQSIYDFILMDVQMPEMDGLEATRKIRKLDGPKKDIPIIAMTATAEKADIGQCLDAGMNDVISKPVKAPTLSEAIQQWVKFP
jgi:two-component system sensor histidine kinase/response regulator